MRILTVPDDSAVLRQKSRLVKKIDGNLAKFMLEMGRTLKNQHDPEGVGLSAVQMGRPARILALNWKYLLRVKSQESRAKRNEPVFYINPEIVEHPEEMTLGQDLVQSSKFKVQSSSDKNAHETEINQRINALMHQPFLEGCLSIPQIYGAVLRYPWIKAKAFVLTEQTLSPNSDSRFQIPDFQLDGDLYYPSSGRCEYNRGLVSEFRLEGLAARVFQHEMDHLNGILFTDHVVAEKGRLYRLQDKEMVEIIV